MAFEIRRVTPDTNPILSEYNKDTHGLRTECAAHFKTPLSIIRKVIEDYKVPYAFKYRSGTAGKSSQIFSFEAVKKGLDTREAALAARYPSTYDIVRFVSNDDIERLLSESGINPDSGEFRRVLDLTRAAQYRPADSTGNKPRDLYHRSEVEQAICALKNLKEQLG